MLRVAKSSLRPPRSQGEIAAIAGRNVLNPSLNRRIYNSGGI